MDKLICKEQSAFIAGRQILDGPLILNETIEWFKRRKEKLLILKSISRKPTTPLTGIIWISCFGFWDSVYNGVRGYEWYCTPHVHPSLSTTVQRMNSLIRRSLRQGDPLSSFLFLIVMEGLHLCIKKKIFEGGLQGAPIGTPPYLVSHLFYADDAILISKWHRDNLECMFNILDDFYSFSGLAINISKSFLFGISVNMVELDAMVSSVGCSKGVLPFNYLGLPMGVGMGQLVNWKCFIDRFKKG
ncbi:uncharacterized protein [Rutidosis leptorrhynchoides]|uniref:uncharacterized protein n=1 Tax=Rutidosis leptorrhynchoides TaxID=125765 RepID=UPI003A99CACD